MDVIATYEAVRTAADRARAGDGPTLVVAACYRFDGHHVGDPENYRSDDEAAAWRARDPIATFRARLAAAALLDDAAAERIAAEEDALIAPAVDAAEVAPLPEPDRAWDDIYAIAR